MTLIRLVPAWAGDPLTRRAQQAEFDGAEMHGANGYFMKDKKRSAALGLAAGLLAGLAGSAAKAAVEAVYPPRTQGQTAPPVILVRKLAGGALDEKSEARAMKWIHFGFGGFAGAVYALMAEFQPVVTTGRGGAVWHRLEPDDA